MPLKKKKKKSAVKKRPAAKKKAIKKPVKKVTKKKPVKKAKKPIKKAAVKENVIGKVTHYFPHVLAAVVKLKAPLNVGDKIKIKGHTTDLTQDVVSMQMDRAPITSAKKGQEIGLQVNSRVRQHDVVIKL